MIADTVRSAILSVPNLAAYTLYGGYAVSGTEPGEVHFAQGHCEKSRENKSGRCSYSLTTYEDGSQLEYRWSDRSGWSLETVIKK